MYSVKGREKENLPKKTSKKFSKPLDKSFKVWYNKHVNKGSRTPNQTEKVRTP
jgi:hypothetical protein